MKTINEYADVLRSKNAGPFHITFDFLFDTEEKYLKVKESNALQVQLIGECYQIPPEHVKIYYFDQARGIKVTIPRKVSSGSRYDTDVYGAQFHTLLMDLVIE